MNVIIYEHFHRTLTHFFIVKDPLYTARWRVFRLEYTFSIRVTYPDWYTFPENIYLTKHNIH
jgi:hypothetical protein